MKITAKTQEEYDELTTIAGLHKGEIDLRATSGRDKDIIDLRGLHLRGMQRMDDWSRVETDRAEELQRREKIMRDILKQARDLLDRLESPDAV